MASTAGAIQHQHPPLELKLLIDRYSVLRFDPACTPLGMLTKVISSTTTTSSSSVVSRSTSLVNISITPAEISVVLPTAAILQDAEFHPQAVENGWLAFRVEPPTGGQGIDFGVVGIMAAISGVLAKADISLFAVSTFDTDYILVKEDRVAVAVKALREHACAVRLEEPGNVQWSAVGVCGFNDVDPSS
ncbi:unnamed protein product [Calypogeia fissa]